MALLRRKLDGTRAQKKSLEVESRRMRSHLKLLLKKSSNDDDLIKDLKQEQRVLKTRVFQQLTSGTDCGRKESVALKNKFEALEEELIQRNEVRQWKEEECGSEE